MAAVCVVKERVKTVGCVEDTGRKAEEGLLSLSRILARVASVRGRENRSRYGRKPKAGEHERDEKQSAPQRRPANRISYG